ncbi:unnamed protein product [Arctogadus glacialis]
MSAMALKPTRETRSDNPSVICLFDLKEGLQPKSVQYGVEPEWDEKNQVLMTNSWLQLHWTDAYLTWNPDNYPGVQNLRFPSDQIWTPDILLYNRSESDPPPPISPDTLIEH